MTILNLSAEAFFDLSLFKHSVIFSGCTYVWEAIHKLPVYLKECAPDKLLSTISNNAYLINPDTIAIGEGSVVEAGAYIKGPCVIGKNCQIRHGAYIRGNVLVGDECVIGHSSEVKNSIFLNQAKAAHFAYVGDSILGNRVNLGAGTVLANLRFDKAPIIIQIEGDRFETGVRKLGAILGDDSQTGCNSVLNPGTLFEMGALCNPCSQIRGFEKREARSFLS